MSVLTRPPPSTTTGIALSAAPARTPRAPATSSTPATLPVALLDLHVVEDHRQLSVRANLARDVEGEPLLVRHRQRQFRVLAVLELEQLVDPVTARAPPELGGLEDRHQHLLAADRVDLLAKDLLDPLHHPVARGQEGPEPRPDPTDQAGAPHQPGGERPG